MPRLADISITRRRCLKCFAQMIKTHQEISILVKGARGSRMEDIVEMVKAIGVSHMLVWLAELLTPHFTFFNVFPI